MDININEKTTLSLYAVAVTVPFLIGGILWLSSIDSRASSAQDELKGLRPMIMDIRERTVRIEEQLKNQRGNK